MLRRIAGLAGLSLLALGAYAHAQSYAQRKTDIAAGILIIDSAQSSPSLQQQNFTPHVWYNLDSNVLVKPAGMNIYNPRPTTQVSQAVYDRWFGLSGDQGSLDLPVLNAPLTKSSSAYWEVRLSAVSDQQLSEYNVLLLSAYGFTNLNALERDRLRKFVDQGGTLWLDIDSATNFGDVQVNTFPVPFQRASVLGGGALTDADVFHPVLSAPYALSLQNLEQMRLDTACFAAPINLAAVGLGGSYWQMESWLELDYSMHFTPVATRLGNPAVLVAQLGAGHVVVTTSEYAMALNRVATSPGVYSPNIAFDGLSPTFDRVSQLAAKFAVNVIYLSAGYAQSGGSSRKPNSGPIDPFPPLLRQTSAGDGNILKGQAPVIYKGLLVVSSGDRVRVYDAKPKTDLDGDGEPDDGIRDSSLGQDYDLLWESQPLGTNISGPTCAEVPGASIKDQIFVVDRNEVIYAFDAFNLANGIIQPGPAGGQPPAYTINPPLAGSYNTGVPNPGPYAPTFHDGLLYVADIGTGGRVWVADPIGRTAVMTGGEPWYAGTGNSGSATLPEPTGSPTIGYIPIQDNSGGYDRVCYIPGRPSGAPGPLGTASITSLWLGARGEAPAPGALETNVANQVGFQTRAGKAGLPVYLDAGAFNNPAGRSLGLKLTVMDIATGDPWSNSKIAQYFTGAVTQDSPGHLIFDLNTPLPTDAGGNLTVTLRLDYSIDWGNHTQNYTQLIVRGNLYLPDDLSTPGGPQRLIIGNIAMSPRGTIYCNLSTEADTAPALAGGTFYAFREDVGRGGFRMLIRYDLYPKHNIALNQMLPTVYDELFPDNDPVTSFMPADMRVRFDHFTLIGTPSVRNGVVYVTALGKKVNDPYAAFGGIPYSILMAFKAEPEAPEIAAGPIASGFTVRQPDVTRSPKGGIGIFTPTIFNEQNQGQFTYDSGEGVIRFDNLMQTNRGPVVNAFSTSQPIILRRPNQPDQLLEPDRFGTKWSPLLWYSVSHGVRPTAGPMTMGGSVFVPGSSIIPNIASLPNLVLSGMIVAWNGNIAANDQYLVGDVNRPWIKQLYQMLFTASGPSANPDLLWPQLTGVTGFEDYIVRARQTKLGNSSTSFGVVGGESILAAWGNAGVYAFSKADFIVADENRLLRVDATGNPRWASNALSSSGALDTATVGELKPLIRPVRAYPIGEADILVADPGANRVARLDLTGRELRSITGFKLDRTNIPQGFKANEPLTLNSPRDVVTFTTYEQNRTQYWFHYLIADTGNRRIVDVVDKYALNGAAQIVDVVRNAANEPQIGVLGWHSPTNYSGKNFDYNSISRVYLPSTDRYYYVTGIGASVPTRTDTGLDTPTGASTQIREATSGNGGVVIFDPIDPTKNLLINQVAVPDVPQNAYWDFSTGSFNSPARPGHVKTLSNVRSVTTRPIFDPNLGTRIAIMFTDATGVYEIYEPTAGNGWTVRWMLTNEAYRALRRTPTGTPLADNALDLRAMYARRMEDGDIIVVNGYVGKTRGDAANSIAQRDFNGEVIQLNGDFDPTAGANGAVGFDLNKPNLGFDLRMIVFQLPPIQGARGLVLPVFADRR